jgi:erythronate-4-phosphate dehydrogenase
MVNVLADKYLFKIESYLPESINLTFYDPESGLPKDLNKTHALLIRTVNSINKETVPDIPSSLSFVGTASAGSDHVDVEYLGKNDITFTDAAGCNARSVAEYIATALLLWSEEREENLSKVSVGVIGVGHVGTQVINLLENLDIEYTAYDPPREMRDSGFTSASINEVLGNNILSFHTPLTIKDEYPTYHWLDAEKLSQNRFKLIINTSRGGVIDEKALLETQNNGTVGDIIIDTWENEPDFSLTTAQNTFIKTPHIAGYSEQAKSNASKIIAFALLDHFDISKPKSIGEQSSRIFSKEISKFNSLSSLLTNLHPIRKYEAELEKIINKHSAELAKYFNRLRAEYPLRQEFAQIYLPASYFERFPILEKLGFSLVGTDSK